MLIHFCKGSLRKNFLREAIAWRSLSHPFILPLLGIYTEESQLFLVSPFMKDGTLTQWRRAQERGVTEIHKLVRTACVRAIEHIHRISRVDARGSQGHPVSTFGRDRSWRFARSEHLSTLVSQSVHRSVCQGNVLLDSTLHCQIADFGSTRHAETTITQSTTAVSVHFAAPELFGMCTKCCEPDCEGHEEGDIQEHRSKTKETDVYAFGCLYYAVRSGFQPTEWIDDDLHRYSLIISLFMNTTTFKFCDSS